MLPRRWTFDHVIAVVELVCAVVGTTWLFAIGVDAAAVPGRTPLDRIFPFALGAALGSLLVRWAIRSWHAGNRMADADGDVDWDAEWELYEESRAAPGAEAPRPAALSPEAERELSRVVGVLADAGVWAPRVPDPADLRGPVADRGEPVTAWSVLSALHEAEFHVPDFDAWMYSADLAFHDSQVEQLVDVVHAQVGDLVRLAGGGLDDVSAVVALTSRDGAVRIPTTITLTVGDTEQVLAYDGAGKYLSTVVHVALARLLRERGMARRLAWVWDDQGVWLSGLRDGAVEELNVALGPAAGEGWQWVDEQEPTAAGDVYPP